MGSAGFELATSAMSTLLLKLEPLLSLFTTDCLLVKEVQSCYDNESKRDLCTSSEEDVGASYRQTDSNKGLSLVLTVEHSQCRVKEVPIEGLANLELQFDHDELVNYTEYRKTELTRKSADWINRASKAFWLSTFGTISATTLSDLRTKTLAKYDCESSKSKVLTFAVGFLKYLAKMHLDLRYRSFELFLERPRRIRVRKNVTNRIVTKEDIQSILAYIHRAECRGIISLSRAEQYTAFTIFGALTGQRSIATMMKLTVGQLRESLKAPKPVLRVEPSQDKIRMEHYVPLHPQVIDAIQPLLDGRQDDELMFQHGSFWMWIKRQKIPMSGFKGHFVLGDLRKFAEQHGDAIGWDQSNRAYIMTHGVSGIDWRHYKHPLPENVYDVYMRYWDEVQL
jgi:integrase